MVFSSSILSDQCINTTCRSLALKIYQTSLFFLCFWKNELKVSRDKRQPTTKFKWLIEWVFKIMSYILVHYDALLPIYKYIFFRICLPFRRLLLLRWQPLPWMVVIIMKRWWLGFASCQQVCDTLYIHCVVYDWYVMVEIFLWFPVSQDIELWLWLWDKGES